MPKRQRDSEFERRFEKKSRIGEGTFCEVYLAEDRNQSGRKCVVKTMRPEDKCTDEAKTEVHALLALRNAPNIVKMIDYTPQELLVTTLPAEPIEVALEQLDMNLLEYLRKLPKPQMSMDQVRLVMRQVLRGVLSCHEKNIVHRDLKPENILVQMPTESKPSGNIKIADFNSAKLPNQKWPSDRIYTSLWFCAPESLEQREGCGTAADMWALGCIMAELLGKPLLRANTGDEKANRKKQLDLIYQLCGVEMQHHRMMWDGVKGLKATLAKRLDLAVDHDCIDLMANLLCYDAKSRITAAEAMKHPFFAKF